MLTRVTASTKAVDQSGADATWRLVYRSGGAAALAVVALVLIQAPLLILYPIPATVLGHFTQLRDNRPLGLINLDLIFLVSQILSSLVFVALFASLRRAREWLMTVALGLALTGIVLYVAVSPTFSLLYLSDQYAAATTDAQRASFLAAGEALWANYQGTAFGVAYILGGIATLLVAAVMLRTRIFGTWTAFIGLLVGATMLLPPLPAVGTVGVVVSYISLVPLVVWEVLVALRLFRLASAGGRIDSIGTGQPGRANFA